MDITQYPQFYLYLLTLHLLLIKNQLLPESCDIRCVNATIINRAYYSAYLFCELWLWNVKKFKTVSSYDFKDDEKIISKHKQVRNALYNFNQPKMGSELNKLFRLRFKADYEPFIDITPTEVSDAINSMEKIFNHLKFE